MAKITLFSKNNCMQCKMTKKFLEQNGADFEEINVDELYPPIKKVFDKL